MARLTVKGNWIDKAIGFVSPMQGARRLAARQAMALLSGGYRGASHNRPFEKWIPGGGSADEDLLSDLPDLRERSRDLNRNDSVAAGATDTLINNVVGSGIKPQSQIDNEKLDISADQALELQDQAEEIYKRWKINADSTNRLDFDDIQALVQRQILENGEILIQPLMLEARRPYSLCLELIEADRLGDPPGKKLNDNIRDGVVLGKRGQPLSYWIKKTHPGSYTRGQYKHDDYVNVRAWNDMGRRNIFHLYHMKRPGQSRGAPWFAPALNTFKNLSEIIETELVTARVAACYAVLVTAENPYNMASNMSGGETDAEGKAVEYLEPGIIKYMKQGDKVEGFTPNRPGNTFDPFVDKILRLIGIALNLPYELIAKDFSKTTWTSGRMALLEARRFFTVRQTWLAKYLCQPIWEMLLMEAWLRGEFNPPNFLDNLRRYCACKWIANGWSWVDPEKEAKGAKITIDNNMGTLTDTLAAKGEDIDDVLETRAREKAKAKAMGKKYGVSMGTATALKEKEEEDDEDEDEDEDKDEDAEKE